MVQAGVHSLEEKAPVHHLNLDEMKLRRGFFNGALVREILYRVEDKAALMQTVIESLKPGSQLMIADIFYDGDKLEGPNYDAWVTGESADIHLWSANQMKEYLESKDIDVRICNDETEEYCSMVLRGWDDFVGRISNTPLSKSMVVPMVHEVELWAKRMAALEAGEIKLYRINGIVKSAVK